MGKHNPNPNISTLQAQVKELTIEVHHHNTELAVVKNNVSWIKKSHIDLSERLNKMDGRVWGILGGIVVSTLISIVLRVL